MADNASPARVASAIGRAVLHLLEEGQPLTRDTLLAHLDRDTLAILAQKQPPALRFNESLCG